MFRNGPKQCRRGDKRTSVVGSGLRVSYELPIKLTIIIVVA